MKNNIIYDGIIFSLYGKGYYMNDKIGYLHRYIWEEYNGKIPEGYHIHHQDEDKSNNDISNLQCVTRSEHMKIHRIGKKLTDETKQKLSDINLGNKRNLGKIHTDEAKFKMSESHLGIQKRIQYTNQCILCGEIFNTTSKSTKYCSKYCNNKYLILKKGDVLS